MNATGGPTKWWKTWKTSFKQSYLYLILLWNKLFCSLKINFLSEMGLCALRNFSFFYVHWTFLGSLLKSFSRLFYSTILRVPLFSLFVNCRKGWKDQFKKLLLNIINIKYLNMRKKSFILVSVSFFYFNFWCFDILLISMS